MISRPSCGAIFLCGAEKLREIDLRVSKLSERHRHVKAPQNVQLVVGGWWLVAVFC
jgi:hypothetical protein